MPRVRNAFKIRAADPPLVDMAQFLQLYCPILLGKLQPEDIRAPKLLIVRGSPGSGKSSILRLFEMSTLLAIHANRRLRADEDLAEQLEVLGAISNGGPTVLGMYIHCDSTLREVAHVGPMANNLGLFNALLDVRITRLFLSALHQLELAGLIQLDKALELIPLEPSDSPPALFAERLTLPILSDRCRLMELAFSAALNSFPDDPLPDGIQNHTRIYAMAYLARQIENIPELNHLTPLIMMDDIQDLYPEQRRHLTGALMERSAIPRWVAVRSQVYGLEELLSTHGVQDGRDFREVDLDKELRQSGLFARFAANVVDRRLRATEYLEGLSVTDFKGLLRQTDEAVSPAAAAKALGNMLQNGADLKVGRGILPRIQAALEELERRPMNISELIGLQKSLIGARRQSNRGQLSLFPDTEPGEPTDAKTEEAAWLFLARSTGLPYYFGFDGFVSSASSNVNQLLSNMAPLADRLVYRAELGRSMAMTTKEQDDMLRKKADEYYNSLTLSFHHGSVIREFIENLGRFFAEVTYRPNAPIAPGVTGFGINRRRLADPSATQSNTEDYALIRRVLTQAVASNILSVHIIRQGSAGSENIVFYLNRLLCIRFRLPLNYGGWQHLSLPVIVRMMQRQLSLIEMSRGAGQPQFSEEEEGE